MDDTRIVNKIADEGYSIRKQNLELNTMIIELLKEFSDKLDKIIENKN